TPHGTVDNVMQVHSLRPHSMTGHVALYKAVLHHPDNALPKWFLEAIGVYTSYLNNCPYSLAHHEHNARVLLGGGDKGEARLTALRDREPEREFSGKYLALLQYVERLTIDVTNMNEGDVVACREAGADDAEILETNQVCGYFNYVNRLLNGLGVTTDGDVIGRYTE
ncbi:MAG TPA: alkylhydroperoxidase, partial [Gammaproteobacteria bacterium]